MAKVSLSMCISALFMNLVETSICKVEDRQLIQHRPRFRSEDLRFLCQFAQPSRSHSKLAGKRDAPNISRLSPIALSSNNERTDVVRVALSASLGPAASSSEKSCRPVVLDSADAKISLTTRLASVDKHTYSFGSRELIKGQM